jgi:hypothetical protein
MRLFNRKTDPKVGGGLVRKKNNWAPARRRGFSSLD